MLWMLQKKVQNLVLWIFLKFHKCSYMTSPKLRCSLCTFVFQLLCCGTFLYHSCFIILSLSAAYARPTLSRTNESILHVTESILAPNKQCSLHFGSRSNPSPLFSSLRLNWVEYLNLSRIHFISIDDYLQTFNKFNLSGLKFLQGMERLRIPTHIKAGLFSNIKICYKRNKNSLFSPNKDGFKTPAFLVASFLYSLYFLTHYVITWRTTYTEPWSLMHISP